LCYKHSLYGKIDYSPGLTGPAQQMYVTHFRSVRENKALGMVCRQEMRKAPEWALFVSSGMKLHTTGIWDSKVSY